MFDPYFSWLGIPAHIPRPVPDRVLLGISEAVTKPEEIHAAANAQIEKLLPYHGSTNTIIVKRIVPEIIQARDRLCAPPAVVANAPKPWWAELDVPLPAVPAPPKDAPWWQTGPAAVEPPTVAAAPPPPPAIVPKPVAVSVPKPVTVNIPKPSQEIDVELVSPAPSTVLRPMPASLPKTTPAPAAFSAPAPVLPPSVDVEDHEESEADAEEDGAVPWKLIGWVAAGGLVLALIIVIGFSFSRKAKTTEPVELVQAKTKSGTETPINPGGEREPVVPVTTRPETKKTPSGRPEIVAFTAPKVYNFHAASVRGIAVRPGANEYVSVSDDRKAIRVYVPNDPSPSPRFQTKNPLAGVIWAQEPGLFFLNEIGQIFGVDEQSKAAKITLKSPLGGFTGMVAAKDGLHLLTASSDGSLRWWDLKTGTVLQTIDVSENKPLMALDLDHHQGFATTGTEEGELSLWNPAKKQLIFRTKIFRGPITLLRFSPDGRQLLCGGEGGKLLLLTEPFREPGVPLEGHSAVMTAAQWVSNGAKLVTVSLDGTILLRNGRDGLATNWSQKVPEKVFCADVDFASRYVVAGSETGKVYLYPLPVAPTIDPGEMATPPEEKYPLPAREMLTAAREALMTKFASDLMKTTPQERLNAGLKFRAEATRKGLEEATRLALFEMSREECIGGQSVAESLLSIDTTSRWFEIDDLSEKTAAIEKLGETLPQPLHKPLTAEILKLLVETTRDKRTELSERLLKVGETSAGIAASGDIQKQFATLRKDLETRQLAQGRLDKARLTLTEKPEDAEANLIVGSHVCFQVGDWEMGLPLLVRSKDAKLAPLAMKDLANPKDAPSLYSLGSDWLAWAKTQTPPPPMVLSRAKARFEAAVTAGLAGTDRLVAISGIGDIDTLLKPKTVTPNSVTTPTPSGPMVTTWRNVNTIRTEAILRNQWNLEGDHRVENDGIRLKSGELKLKSKFALTTNWKIVMVVTGDGRDIGVTVNGELITVNPGTANGWALTIERRGNKVSYVSSRGNNAKESSFTIPEDKLGASSVELQIPASNVRNNMLIQAITISGAVRTGE